MLQSSTRIVGLHECLADKESLIAGFTKLAYRVRIANTAFAYLDSS